MSSMHSWNCGRLSVCKAMWVDGEPVHSMPLELGHTLSNDALTEI